MSLLAAAAFVLPLMPQPEPYTMPAPRHEGMVMAQSGAAAPPEIPQSVWQGERDAKATHLQSQLTCAKAFDEFERERLVVFDGFGFDVACNYQHSTTSTVTLYLTRRQGRQLSDDLAGAEDAIKKRWPGVAPAIGATAAPTGLAFQGTLYTLPNGMRTGVWVADISGWTLKFRATYVPDQEAITAKAMSSLAQSASASAAPQLSACAAAPAVTRDGKAITDQDRISQLSLMSGVFDAAKDLEDKPAAQTAERWCAENGTGDNDAPMLFWRNVTATSTSAGPVDRLTLMTMGPAPALLSVFNPDSSLVEKEAGSGEVMIHQLTEKRDDTTYVFAFFAGRPSMEALTPISKEIFRGRLNPVTSYNAKTKTITLPMGSDKPGT